MTFRSIALILALLAPFMFAHAQSSSSNAKATLSIAGQQSFVLTAPGQIANGFKVRLVDPQNHPIPGITIEFFGNGFFCIEGDPNCTNPPSGLFGQFTPITFSVLTDADGYANADGFEGGTVSGLYTVAALISYSASAANAALIYNGYDLTVVFDIDQSFASQPFGVQSGISGSWFDPNTSGQGFNFEVLSSNQFLVYFYTFDNNGHNLWLVGNGTVSGNVVHASLTQVDGGFFPPRFDPTKIVNSTWGNLILTFADCDHATAAWTVAPEKATQFTSGSLDIQRLTRMPELHCQ